MLNSDAAIFRFLSDLHEYNSEAPPYKSMNLPERLPRGVGRIDEHDDRDYVLIVEDDWDIRDTIEQLLIDEGYRVKVAGNGIEALAILDDDYTAYFAAFNRDDADLPPRPVPNVILLDIHMPIQDGLEFFALLRYARPAFRSAKIIAMSAATSITKFQALAVNLDGNESEDRKTTHAIKKPFALAELLMKVKKACEGSTG